MDQEIPDRLTNQNKDNFKSVAPTSHGTENKAPNPTNYIPGPIPGVRLPIHQSLAQSNIDPSSSENMQYDPDELSSQKATLLLNKASRPLSVISENLNESVLTNHTDVLKET